MKISYFYSKEISESVELKEKVLKLSIINNCDVNIIDSSSPNFNQLEFLISCHRDDIVIVDCTIPKDSTIKTVYPILVAQVNMLDHVIVISNNMLPLNITPQRQGYDSPRLKLDFTQEKQINWIEEQLLELSTDISSNNHYNRIPLNGYQDLERFRSLIEKMWEESDNYRRKKEGNKKKVLISYRNSHYKEVAEYKAKYEKKHPNTIVRMIEPGVLCTGEETLTPMRKWMLVFMLEERIHDIEELIIYKTNDYTDSWWTCAELVMVAYNNYNRDNSKKIKVTFYDPYTEKESEEDAISWLIHPTLNESQKNRLSRLAANTRPDTMGPECMNNIDQMRSICESIKTSNFIIRSFLKWGIRQMLKKSIPTTLSKRDKKEMLKKTIKLYTNKDELDLYLSDDVFQDNFWNKLSYQTEWPTPAFIKVKDNNIEKVAIDIEAFLNAPMNELISLTEEELQTKSKLNEKVTIHTENKHVELNVKESENKCYLWLATRMGQPIVKGNNPPGLEEIPIFELSE